MQVSFRDVFVALSHMDPAQRKEVLKNLDADTDRKTLEQGLKCLVNHSQEPPGAALKLLMKIQATPPSHTPSNIFQQFAKWFQNTFLDRVSSQKLLDQIDLIKSVDDAKDAVNVAAWAGSLDPHEKADYRQMFSKLAEQGDRNAYLYLAKLEFQDNNPAKAIEYLKKGAHFDKECIQTLIGHYIGTKNIVDAKDWMEEAIVTLAPLDLLECVVKFHEEEGVRRSLSTTESLPVTRKTPFSESKELLAAERRGEAIAKLKGEESVACLFQLAYEHWKDDNLAEAEACMAKIRENPPDEISNFCIGKAALLYTA